MPFNCWPKHGVISRLMKWVWNVCWNEGFVAIEAPKGDIQSEPTSHSNTTRQRQVFYLTSNLDTHMSKLCVQLVGSCSSDALHEECMPSLVTSFSTTVSTLPSTNSLHRNVAALGAEAMMKNSSNQTQVWADGRTQKDARALHFRPIHTISTHRKAMKWDQLPRPNGTRWWAVFQNFFQFTQFPHIERPWRGSTSTPWWAVFQIFFQFTQFPHIEMPWRGGATHTRWWAVFQILMFGSSPSVIWF